MLYNWAKKSIFNQNLNLKDNIATKENGRQQKQHRPAAAKAASVVVAGRWWLED